MTQQQESSPLPRSAPEAQGVASSALLDFINAVEENIRDLHSLMLLRRGHVIAEGWWSPYEPDRPHMLFSLSKSFTATAAGLARAEGRLSFDDPVLKFFPEDAPEQVSDNLAAMRVRHLLSMSTGHAEDTLGPVRSSPDGNWIKAFLSQPVEYEPGTHFLYNSGATYMVSAIVQKVTGQTLLNYLQLRLFAPLGIADPTWESCPRGINVGGWGLNIRTEEIARFGQLYLQQGVWDGKRLLPNGWVEEATARHISNGDDPNSDWNQGYGYQFWRSRHGAYRGDGAFGQFCIVMPEQEAVLATTAGVGDMQAVLNLVWKHLLPALSTTTLPADDAAEQKLRQRLSSLALRPPQGSPSSPISTQVSGKTYRFEPNDQKIESVTLDFGADESVLRVVDHRGEHRIKCGSNGVWLRGETAFDTPTPAPRPIAASGAWSADDPYVLKLCFTTTPFSPTLTFRFTEDRLLLDYHANVSFGPLDRPEIQGVRVLGN